MSTPENADVSPWDQIIGHVIDQLQEGVINTGGIQWVSHIAPDFEYLPAGPAGWVYPIFDEFPQGDVAGGFNSEFEFVIHLFLPESGGDYTQARAIRTDAWNILQMIAHIISKKPPDFPGTWESVRVRRVRFPSANDGSRLLEQVMITCLAKFRVVIPRA